MRRLAVLDVVRLCDSYEMRSPGLGDRFLEELDKVFGKLEQSPFLYQDVHLGIRRAALKKFPVGVFYRVVNDKVHVIAVEHFSRDPSVWRSRR